MTRLLDCFSPLVTLGLRADSAAGPTSALRQQVLGLLIDARIRAGEAGDRFFIGTGGECEIQAGNAHVTAHAGDHFGEIALLRDVPRTATVTAVVDSQVYALGRNDFLAAVTGHADVRAAGEDIAAERLARGTAAPSAGA